MWPASWSASSRYCVVRKTVVPPAASSRMISHMVRRLRGSRPVVGSSRKMMRAWPTSVIARASLRRMPPEYEETSVCAAPARPNRSSSRWAVRLPSALGRCSRSAIMRRFSSPVSSWSTEANCPVTPMAARTAPVSAVTSCPATVTFPASGGSRVVSTFTIVVLPAPLGPSRAKIVPFRTSRSMPSSTTWSRQALRNPETATAVASTSRLPGDGQALDPVDVRGLRAPGDLAGRGGQPERGEAVQQRGEGDAHLDAGQLLAQALVDAVAGGQVAAVLAGQVDRVGVGEAPGVAVGGVVRQDHRRAGLDRVAAELDVLQRGPHERLGHAQVPHQLLHGAVDERGLGAQRLQLGRVAQQ